MQIDSTTEAGLKSLLQYIMNPRQYVQDSEQTINPTNDDMESYSEWSQLRARYIYEKLFNNPNNE